MPFQLSPDLETEILLGQSNYVIHARRIAQEIRVGLRPGEAYTLFTRHNVTPPVRVVLKELKTALHAAFGDNGARYYVTLQEVDHKKDKVAVVIKRATVR